MTGGMLPPWPFPWKLPNPASSLASAAAAGFPDGGMPLAQLENEQPFVNAVAEAADKLSQRFGKSLPPAKSTEIYLIQALSEPSTRLMSVSDGGPLVIYPPEFLFVLDVGLQHLVGASVIWEAPAQYGDPSFPWKKDIAVRSIRERTYRGLVYPSIAGSLMIGLIDGVSLPEVAQSLSDFGLQDVQGAGFFVTANCAPFEEARICRELEAAFDFIKYAEMNNVVRIIDFSPGWNLARLV